MNSLQGLQPTAVWDNFSKLLAIPRPSKKEEKVVSFMKKWAEDLGLTSFTDKIGNVIIRKEATPGMEDRKGVIMQGHLDMVPQKNSDKIHDFEKDPIEAYIDGDWVTANGTTLGADNGIGVAAAMAVLESKDIVHGPLEALFTIDEETGMTGAFGLEKGILEGDILLNMDSEDEGELYIGCAGGVNTNASMDYETEKTPENHKGYKVSVKGLKGGHSGMDIVLGRGNSNKIMNRFLRQASCNYNLRLACVDGGSLRNAIPRESFATVAIPSEKEANFKVFASDFETIINEELKAVEIDFKFDIEPTQTPDEVMIQETAKKLYAAVQACINGVVRMSDAMPGVVETSTNLAIVKAKNKKIEIKTLQRSSSNSAKDDIARSVGAAFCLMGAEIEHEGDYPGWNPNMDSAILETMKNVYQDKFGSVPEIKIIHAGLECGLLGGVYPNWDMISFGPTIRSPHSPDEKLKIETVETFYKWLVETLKVIPKK